MRATATSSAFAAAAAISLGYLAIPVYDGSDGPSTVVEANGAWVVGILALPLAIALAALPERHHAPSWTAALAMTAFAIVTGFTIGVPYLLPAAVLWIAALRSAA